MPSPSADPSVTPASPPPTVHGPAPRGLADAWALASVALHQGLAAVKADGTYERIFTQCFGAPAAR